MHHITVYSQQRGSWTGFARYDQFNQKHPHQRQLVQPEVGTVSFSFAEYTHYKNEKFLDG